MSCEIDFIAKEVKYHHICHMDYLSQTTLPLTDTSDVLEPDKVVEQKVTAHIHNAIIKNSLYKL